MSLFRFAALLALLLTACTPSSEGPPAAMDTEPAPTPDEPALFEERAASLGLGFVHQSGATGKLYFPETLPPGAALLDYDHDGDLDVYVVQGGFLDDAGASKGEAQDQLFRNDLTTLADGSTEPRFVDVTESSGIDAHHYGMGIATADVNGDGWLDLYVTNLGPNQLWINRGDGTFRDATAEAGVDDPRWSTSASFFDYDLDGDQDLYVACYKDWSPGTHRPCHNTTGAPDYCGPASFTSTADRLFRNRGDGRFEDVSASTGILLQYGAGLGVLTGDFDDNRHPDIYVANDQDPNFLWLNRTDGAFLERALLAGTAVNQSGLAEGSMGVDAGDVDGDGDLDLFMTHFRDETNTLYFNDGHGFFRDGTNATRLGQPSRPFTGFGTAFLDFDSDGWLDVVVANGRVSIDPEQQLAGEALPLKEPNQLFRNLGGRFEDVSSRASAAFLEPAVSRGLAVGDVDQDGDGDILIANAHGPTQLFMNRLDDDGSAWLGVRTRGRDLAPATGVLLHLDRTDEARLTRVARSDGSYLSVNDPRVVFGLANGGARQLEISFPTGQRVIWHLDPGFAGRYLTVAIGRSSEP